VRAKKDTAHEVAVASRQSGAGYRRLNPRYERDPRNYLAVLGLAASLCCYKRLIRLTT
jgi:hypothetical protein